MFKFQQIVQQFIGISLEISNKYELLIQQGIKITCYFITVGFRQNSLLEIPARLNVTPSG